MTIMQVNERIWLPPFNKFSIIYKFRPKASISFVFILHFTNVVTIY